MGNRSADWLRQADANLRHARNALASQDCEWSCFAAEQAGEKAVKAVFLARGMDAWGHTITTLLGRMPGVAVPDDVLTCAKMLDKHYIPTRCPNGFDSGAPTDSYTRKEAEDALSCAAKIIEFCGHQVHGSGDSPPGGV